jgi:hypothetical protein
MLLTGKANWDLLSHAEDAAAGVAAATGFATAVSSTRTSATAATSIATAAGLQSRWTVNQPTLRLTERERVWGKDPLLRARSVTLWFTGLGLVSGRRCERS